MMLRLEALRSCALPLLLNAADRLMSGKSAATLTPINAFSVSICRSAAAGRSISSVGDGRFATLIACSDYPVEHRAESLRLRPRSIRGLRASAASPEVR